jgi:hypothetical protein
VNHRDHYLLPWLLIPVCFAALFLTCYHPVIVGDRQFGYRDSAHYYYPLHKRVQEEWAAGRWPLWEPEENAGMPLLGNPTAAVLYPGKLVFAVLPYAWGARIYVVGHTLLAFVAMLVLMRSWRASWSGSTLSALGYAFGAPILFQYSNVIYLVGAAWLPLGIRAVDRWVRLGRRFGLLELAIVLAMQTLGGDPQSAYLLGGAAGGYATGMAWSSARANSKATHGAADSREPGFPEHWFVGLLAVGFALWIAVTLVLASWLPTVRPPGFPAPPLPWMAWVPAGVVSAWVLAGLLFLVYWRRSGWRSRLGGTMLGLALSAALAIALSAAQLVPVIEFTLQTARAAGVGPHDLYPFSVEPLRLVELVWPNVFGQEFGGNSYWRDALRLPGSRPATWTPSLYLGGLTLVLACGTMATRHGPPWRVWLSVLSVLAVVASLGQYTSPIWAVRALAQITAWTSLEHLAREVGPLDLDHTTAIRLDRFLRDGDGSVYWWLATLLPGFKQFRFPAKLFTFGALGMAALAGLGWDAVRSGRSGKARALLASLLLSSLAALAVVWIERSAIRNVFRHPAVPSMFGPLDADGAFRALCRSLIHASVVAGCGLALLRLTRTRPRWAGALAVIVATADLAAANARYVVTVPQAVLDARPEVLKIIDDAERRKPGTGPYRIERMQAWHPPAWQMIPAARRAEEIAAWEHDTIQAKYGINFGVEYTHTFGVGQLAEYDWFFDGAPRVIRSPEAARILGIAPGTEVIYFPRRSFDMWNTRYFVVPSYAHEWRDPFRSYASFLFQIERIYPTKPVGAADVHAESLKQSRVNDFQILRNQSEFPRAWVVHNARWLSSLTERSEAGRNRAMLEMLYADDPIWHDATMLVFDPRAMAWVDDDEKSELAPYLSGLPPSPLESVKVTYPTPQQAELEATLQSPGLVILADVVYPGWELTIDGKSAPIYRVNRLMRGAAVPSGTHHLVYNYAPRSFKFGAALSLVGLVILALATIACALRPGDPSVGAGAAPPDGV